MAKDLWGHGLDQVVVEVWIGSHQPDVLQLLLGEVGLAPLLLLHGVRTALEHRGDLIGLGLEVVQVDRVGEDRELVGELAGSEGLEAPDALAGGGGVPAPARGAAPPLLGLVGAAADGRLVAHQRGGIRNHDERSREHHPVSGPGLLHIVVPHDHVDRPRHAPRRDLVRVLLHAEPLPVHKLARVPEQVERGPVAASGVGAVGRGGEAELLLHAVVHGAALAALEGR
mmetsp:Transcript_4005/g.12055  ORF Transcript_4005/g.12055 Transcript_4005/m.12055 type:complete len:227 (-) Transcript_4005:921-1601(-)